MKQYSIAFFLVVCFGCMDRSDTNVSLPAITNHWEYRSGKYAEKPIVIRINRALDAIIANNQLKYQAAVSVTIKHPLKTGLPDDSELDSLKKIETRLIEKLVNPGLAVFALEIKSDKTCDFIFYAGNKKMVKKAFTDLQHVLPDYQTTFSLKRDPKWITYRWFSSWE